jgi:hypothetical protein
VQAAVIAVLLLVGSQLSAMPQLFAVADVGVLNLHAGWWRFNVIACLQRVALAALLAGNPLL